MTTKADWFAHETAVIDEGAVIGAGTKIWHFTHIMPDTHIGENCNFGQNIVVSPGCRIGNNVKVQNNVSIYTGVMLDDDVFCGPSMVFTNVINPRSHIERKDEYRSTHVGRGASIGANATIICGNDLGRYCMIGAGAVVTRSVPDYALVLGNPARLVGYVCYCGERLALDVSDEPGSAICVSCRRSYRKDESTVQEIVNGESQ